MKDHNTYEWNLPVYLEVCGVYYTWPTADTEQKQLPGLSSVFVYFNCRRDRLCKQDGFIDGATRGVVVLETSTSINHLQYVGLGHFLYDLITSHRFLNGYLRSFFITDINKTT